MASLKPTFGKAVLMGHLINQDIGEASGLAASHRNTDIFWTHNDSGNPAVIYALSGKGGDLGQVHLTGAKNIDWEDMASFQWKNRPYLLIADVGDNRAKRKTCTLYIIEEPALTDKKLFSGEVSTQWQINFQYEDGPRDCEAVTVDVTTGQCLLLTKRDNPPQLYTVPLFPSPGKTTPVIAEKIAVVPTIPGPDLKDLAQPYGKNRSQPTAMDITSDGQTLVILTYKNAYLYSKTLHQTWRSRLKVNPEIIYLPPVTLTSLVQREGLCFSSDGRWLYLTSEQLPTPLYRLNRILFD